VIKNENVIKLAAQAIRNADAIVILAGAGMGVDSGLPDFRGKSGFWNAYPMLEKENLSFYDMASPAMFKTNENLAWGFYGQRLNLYRETQPHTGFEILKKIAEQMPSGYFVYTSNVDGQFQKAGFDSNCIVECHGSIHHVQKLNPRSSCIMPADSISIDVDPESLLAKRTPYDGNGGLLRPNILMFDDYDWVEARTIGQQRKFKDWQDELLKLNSPKIVLLEIGAGDDIATVRRQSFSLKRTLGATYIQINPKCSGLADISLKIEAITAINQIERSVKGV